MMAAASSGVRALTKGDAKSWLIFKCIVAVFCAPLAVFMELHAFDKVALILYGISTLLWLFGWLPGVFFALAIILSSTFKNTVFGWFKKPAPEPAPTPSFWQKLTGGGKPDAGAATASGSGAKPAAASAKPAAPAPAPAAAAPAPAPAAPAAKAPPPSNNAGWFGGGASNVENV